MLGFIDANGKHLGPCLFQKDKEPVPCLPKPQKIQALPKPAQSQNGGQGSQKAPGSEENTKFFAELEFLRKVLY